jgi:hypothetical protein
MSHHNINSPLFVLAGLGETDGLSTMDTHKAVMFVLLSEQPPSLKESRNEFSLI